MCLLLFNLQIDPFRSYLHKVDHSKWLCTKAVPSDNIHISYKHQDQVHTAVHVERNSLGNPYILPLNHLKWNFIQHTFHSISS